MLHLRQIILVEAYLTRLRKRLKYTMKTKLYIIHDTRCFIYKCIREGDKVTTEEDLHRLFNTPEGYAAEIMATQTSVEFSQYISETRLVQRVVGGVLTFLLLLAVYYLCDELSERFHIAVPVSSPAVVLRTDIRPAGNVFFQEVR